MVSVNGDGTYDVYVQELHRRIRSVRRDLLRVLVPEPGESEDDSDDDDEGAGRAQRYRGGGGGGGVDNDGDNEHDGNGSYGAINDNGEPDDGLAGLGHSPKVRWRARAAVASCLISGAVVVHHVL